MPTSGTSHVRRVLLCSTDERLAAAALQAVGRVCVLAQETDEPSRVQARIAAFDPHVVFIDFQPDALRPERLAQAADLARLLRRAAPQVPLVALGTQDQAQGPLAALRAGVQDFVDPYAEPDEMRMAVERVAGNAEKTGAAVQRLAVVGVRPGVGCSLLAVHVCDLLQRRAAAQGEGLVLCDLGWPVADAQLYLGLRAGDMDFAQAVHNLARLDKTLVRTAFAHEPGGLALVPLPDDLNAMQSVSHAGALDLLETLSRHFGMLVADLGGFPHMDFVSRVAGHAEQSWIVTDQSVGALVSLAQMLRELDARDVPRARLRLIVNRYDEAYGLSAEQIAQRFGLTLLGAVPDRSRALMTATAEGRLLTTAAESDPYVRALQGMIDTVWPEHSAERARAGWLQRLFAGERGRAAAAKSRLPNA